MENKYTKISIFLLTAIILVFFITFLRESLISNHFIGKGRIVRYEKLLKTGGNVTLILEFKANEKLYTSSFDFSCKKLDLNILNKKFTNKSLFVAYNKSNPYFLNQPLLKESDYDSYNISIPDFLKWLDSLVTCKYNFADSDMP